MSCSARRRRTMRLHGRIAFKTGTSYGYRDAWAVGFDGQMTIGVRVGRADGAPVPGLVSASAALILFDAFARSGHGPAPLPPAPKGSCSPPRRSCRRRCGISPPARASMPPAEPPRIMFPPDGARLERHRPSGRPGRLEDRWRGNAAHGYGQWCPVTGQRRPPQPVISTRRAGFRAFDGHGRPRRDRQRQWSGCSKIAYRSTVELTGAGACAYWAAGANEFIQNP